MDLTRLEQALLCAAKAFAACYMGTELPYPGEPMPKPQPTPQGRPTATSNGKNVCMVHGKEMKPSKFGGYMCTAKLEDGTYCKARAR